MNEEDILNKFREYVKTKTVEIDPEGRLYLHPHLIDTEDKLLILDPNANPELRIAALGHDIDRIWLIV